MPKIRSVIVSSEGHSWRADQLHDLRLEILNVVTERVKSARNEHLVESNGLKRESTLVSHRNSVDLLLDTS